jgi:endonuclease/exonuclease/phosphatase family metal-dependent hydrolase
VHEAPDVVCLQEVVFAWQAAMLDEFLRCDYQTFHTSSKFGLMKRGGLYVAIRKLLRVEDYSFSQFKDQGSLIHPLAYSDRLLSKGWSTVTVSNSNEKVHILNTHLLGAYGFDNQSEQRTVLNQKNEIALSLSSEDYPVVVCGDFNLTPKAFSEDSYFRSLCEVFSMDDQPITVDNQNNPLRQGRLAQVSGRGSAKPNKRIDFIFYNRLKMKESRRIFDKPLSHGGYNGHLSDHYGIHSQFDFAL